MKGESFSLGYKNPLASDSFVQKWGYAADLSSLLKGFLLESGHETTPSCKSTIDSSFVVAGNAPFISNGGGKGSEFDKVLGAVYG